MTLNGAIMQLVEMRENSMMPMVFKPYFDKVIETVSECEEPSPNSSESPNGWIPCTPETMPEEYQDVLVTLSDSDGSFVKEMQYIKGLFETDGDLYGVVDEKDSVDCADSFKAIAWMPLLSAYKRGEQK
jgi:hypothetical protein